MIKLQINTYTHKPTWAPFDRRPSTVPSGNLKDFTVWVQKSCWPLKPQRTITWKVI